MLKLEPVRTRQPLALGTVAISTRVVGDALMVIRIALFDMSAVRQCNIARWRSSRVAGHD